MALCARKFIAAEFVQPAFDFVEAKACRGNLQARDGIERG
jgi:hypothetical protein